MDSNCSEHGGDQKVFPPVTERKGTVYALYGMYADVLHDLEAVLKESTAEKEAAKTTITESPSSEEFCD